MTDQKKLLQEIVKNLNGMSKIEAYDLTHKLETILFYASNPIDSKNIEHMLTSGLDNDREIDPLHFTILPNGNFCEFLGHNNWLHIYKENKRMVPNWSIFDTYYYKTKYAPIELIKLTRKNLLQDLKGKPEEKKVRDFLKKCAVCKKDVITNKLLILES